MSAESTIPAEFFPDSPSRTWRSWWLARPKWFRIGCWAVLGAVLLHILLAARIAIGLMGSREIQFLRRRGAHIEFESDWRPIRFRGQYTLNILADGMIGRGRNNEDVFSIELTGANEPSQGCTDLDLEFIADYFPNLKRLWISHSPVSFAGLKSLQRCQHLQDLVLSDTDIGDEAAVSLAALKRLRLLSLASTLISDKVLDSLQDIPGLVRLNVAYTDVSLEAIQRFRQQASNRTMIIGSILDKYPESMIGSIRWSDGVRSGQFADKYEITLEGPLNGEDRPDVYVFSWEGLWRHDMWWDVQEFAVNEPQTMGFSARRGKMKDKHGKISLEDGDYRVTLELGRALSEPVNVSIQDGKPSTHLIEFKMPCTKANLWRTEVE